MKTAPIGVPNKTEASVKMKVDGKTKTVKVPVVTDADMEAAKYASKRADAPRHGETAKRIFHPQASKANRERGGVTKADLEVVTSKTPAKRDKVDKVPSITGGTNGIGVPTEPERGGVNKAEMRAALEGKTPKKAGKVKGPNKKELIAMAEGLGLEVPKKANKAEIQALIDGANSEEE